MDYYLLEKDGENSKCGILDLGKCIESQENSAGENDFTTSSEGIPSSFSNDGLAKEGQAKTDSRNANNFEDKQVIGSSDDQVMRFLKDSHEEICQEENEGTQMEKGAETCDSSDSVFRNIIDMRDGVELRGDTNQLFGIGKITGLSDKTEEKTYSEETVSDIDHTASSTTTADEDNTKSNLSSDITNDPKPGKSLDEILDHFCDDNSGIVVTQGSSYREASNPKTKELPSVPENQDRNKSQLFEDRNIDADKIGDVTKINKMNHKKMGDEDTETQKCEIQEVEDSFPKIFPEEEKTKTEVVSKEDIIEEVDKNFKAGKFEEKLEETREEVNKEDSEETVAEMHTEIYRTQSEEKEYDIEDEEEHYVEAEKIPHLEGIAKTLNKDKEPNELKKNDSETDKVEDGSKESDNEKKTDIQETDESEKCWNRSDDDVSNSSEEKELIASEVGKDTKNSLQVKAVHAENSSWTTKKRILADVENSTSTRKKLKTFSDDGNSNDLDKYLEDSNEIMDNNAKSHSKGLEIDKEEMEEDQEESQMERISAEERRDLHSDQKPKEKPVNGFEYDETEAVNIAETEVVNIVETETVNIAETEAVSIAETEAVNIVETEAVNIVETEAVNIGETEAVNIAETEAVDIAEAEAMDTAETESVQIAEAEAVNIAEAEAVNIAETEAMNVAETEAVNIAESESTNIAETEAMEVAEEEHGKEEDSFSADTSKETVSVLQNQEKTEQKEKNVENSILKNLDKDEQEEKTVEEDSRNLKSSEDDIEREEISDTLSDLVKDAVTSADEEEVHERTKVFSKAGVKELKAQPNASKVTLLPGKAASSLTCTSTESGDVLDNKSDSSVDFDEESIENISRTIRSFSNEKPPSKKIEKRLQNSSKNDDPSHKKVIVVKTAPNVEKVKQKLEEILEKSKGEEDAAIAELQRMKKEKTDILNAITTEMEKLKSMLVKDKQG